MRYRLRTLLILLAVLPAMLAGGWWRYSAWMAEAALRQRYEDWTRENTHPSDYETWLRLHEPRLRNQNSDG